MADAFFGVEVEGWEEVARGLHQAGNEIPPAVESELTQAAFPVYFNLADYPSPRPGQKYVRTFEYRRLLSYVIESAGNVVMLTFKQGAAYSRYLRGDGDKYPGAWMHVGRWRSLKDIIDTFTPVVEFKLQAAVQRLISRLGLGK